ncbi:unnamed protein product [Schistosoma haematobium]|nr:unnamed protein product [Schistosoma haematobium]
MPKTKGKQKLKKGTKRKSGKAKRKGRSSRQKKPKHEIDIMSLCAMENLYYIAHNAPCALMYRGFRWSRLKPKRGKAFSIACANKIVTKTYLCFLTIARNPNKSL